MPNAVVMTGYGPPEVLQWAQQQAAEAHRQLESGNARQRIILTFQ
jgi:hypothetical protein